MIKRYQNSMLTRTVSAMLSTSRQDLGLSLTVFIMSLHLISAYEDVIAATSRELDLAALDIMQTNFPLHRQIRSFIGQSESAKGSHELQKILLDKMTALEKIVMNNPSDVRVFAKQNGKEKAKNVDLNNVRIVVAENSHGSEDYSSFVKIYKYTNSSFQLETQLQCYAPYRVEPFTVDLKHRGSAQAGVAFKSFLAVGSKVDAERMVPRSMLNKFSLYRLDRSWVRIYHVGMEVSALKFVSTHNADFLVVADRLSEHVTFINILKFDAFEQNFRRHDRFPVSQVSDIEVVEFQNEVYLLVALYNNYFSKLEANSLILKYDSTSKAFRQYSTFETVGVLDLHVFGSGNKMFIVAANEASRIRYKKKFGVPSVIYRVAEEFQLKRVAVIPTVAAKQTAVVRFSSCNWKRLIITIDESDSIDQMNLYVFDMEKEKVSHRPVSFFEGSSKDGKPNPRRIDTVVIDDRLYVILATQNTKVNNVLEIKYEIASSRNPIEKLYTETRIELKKLLNSLKAADEFIAKANDVLADAVLKESGQRIKGPKQVIGNLHAGSLQIGSLVIDKGALLIGRNASKSRVSEGLNALELKFQNEQNRVNQSKAVMANALFLDERSFSGSHHFLSVKYSGNAQLGVVRASSINGVKMDHLIEDIVLQNTTDTIHATKSVTADATAENVDLLGKINKIAPAEDFVTVFDDQTIESSKIESDDWGFNDSLELKGLLNSVDIKKDTVSLGSSEKILGRKMFTNALQLRNSTVKGLIDGIDVTKLTRNSMLKNGKNFLTGVKTFPTETNLFDDLIVDGLVDNIDLQNLSNEVIRIGISANFSSNELAMRPKKFIEPIHIQGHLNVSDNVNYLKFPNDLLLVNCSQNISGTKTFVKGCSILDDVKTFGLVDGLRPDHLILLSERQPIYGKKIFTSNIVLKGNVDVKKGVKVDNCFLRELNGNILSLSSSQIETGRCECARLEFNGVEPILLDSSMLTSTLRGLYDNAVLVDGDQLITGNNKLMASVSVVENATVSKKINGHRFPSDFMDKNNDQTVSTGFYFRNVISKNGVQLKGRIAGVDLTELEQKIVTWNTEGVVSGEKIFADELKVAGDLTCKRTVNNVDLAADLLLKNGKQTIAASKKTFESMKVHNMNVFGNISVFKTVDGVDLSEFTKRAVIVSEQEFIFEKRVFNGNLKVENLNFDFVNNVSLAEIFEDIVTLNSSQVISVSKSFEDVRVMGHLLTNATVDEIDLKHLEKSIVNVRDNVTIDGETSFDHIAIQEVQVKGRIHGESLQELYESVAQKGRNVNFTSDFQVFGNMKASGNINCRNLNGYDPASDLVLKSKNQTISGRKIFLNDVVLMGGLIAAGKVNDVELEKLEQEAVTKSTPQIIKGRKITRDITANGDVSVNEEVDSVKLGTLALSVAYTDRACVFKKPMTFTSQTDVKRSLKVSSLVNGKNLSRVIEDSVTVSNLETINGETKFVNGLEIVCNLVVEGDVVIKGHMNSVNISWLLKDLLKVDGNQVVTGKKYFANTVQCLNEAYQVGFINGIDTEQDLVTLTKTQKIFGKKTFSKDLESTGDVRVALLVDGYDISNLSKDTLRRNQNSEQDIRGVKIFKALPTISSNLTTRGTLDGIDLCSSAPLTLHSNQTVSGLVMFKSNLQVAADVRTKNSRFGKRLLGNRVMLDKDQVMKGTIVFKRNFLGEGTLVVSGTINSLDLLKIKRKMWNTVNAVELASRRAEKRCKMLDYLEKLFDDAPLYIDFFETFQTFERLETKEMYHFKIDLDHFLAMSVEVNKACVTTKIFKWNMMKMQFMEYQKLPMIGGKKFAFFAESKEQFLLVAADADSCSSKGSTVVFRFDQETALFKKHKTMKIKDIVDFSVYNDGKGTTVIIAYEVKKGSSQTDSFFEVFKWKEDSFHSISRRCAMQTRVSFVRIYGNYLIFATNQGMWHPVQNLRIYRMNVDKLALVQQFYTPIVSDLVLFDAFSTVYMVAGHHSASIGNFVEGGQISIFRYSASIDMFVPMFSISARKPVHLGVIRMKKQIFISVANLCHGFTLYNFKGEFGILEGINVPHKGLMKTSVFEVNGTSYLGLAVKRSKEMYTRQHEPASSKILKLTVTGINTRFTKRKETC